MILMKRECGHQLGRWLGSALVASAVAWTVQAAEPRVWYVDDDNYNQTGLDGSEEKPYGTIQDAVSKAAAGDTVIVLPGTYDKGATKSPFSSDATSNRVSIAKAITVKSRDGATNTFIVGAADYAGDPKNGLGSAAIRCVAISANGAVLSGFTLTGGHVYQSTGGDCNTVRGGGVLMQDAKDCDIDVVDCVISNNVATRGAGGFGGTFVRTLFTDNRVENTASANNVNSAACRTCKLYNCVLVGNGYGSRKASETVGWCRAIVNCTFAGNNTTYALANSTGVSLKNCLAEQNGAITYDNTVDHCLTNGVLTSSGTVTTTRALMAASFGDFRPVTASGVSAAGDTAALSDIPEAYRDKDFLGKSRKTGETVSIGAVETSVTPAGGCIAFTAVGAVVSGVALRAGDYFYAETSPSQIYLASSESAVDGEDFFAFIVSTTSWGKYPAFPDRQNGRWLTMPTSDETFFIRPKYGTLLQVNGATKAATEDGSAAAPYKTIQAAVDSCPYNDTDSYYVISVARGDYAGTNTTHETSGASTVLIDRRNILLKASAGPQETRILGVRAETTSGQGDGAARCVQIIHNTSVDFYTAVSGFTLANGATAVGSSGSDAKGQGGAVYVYDTRVRAARFTHILDCIITNCVATRGPAGYQGWYQRCLMTGNTDGSGINSITRECVMSSCVLMNNTAAHVIIGQNVSAYNCTGRGLAGRGNYFCSSTGGCSFYNTLLLNGICNSSTINSTPGSFCETTEGKLATGITYGCADVVSIADGDFRPYSTSPLVTSGAGPDKVDDFDIYTISDFENKPLVFTDGKPTVGAYNHPVARVVIEHAENVVFQQPVTNGVGVGEQLTVSVTHPGEKRLVLGLVVDGVTNRNTFAHTFTGAEGAEHRISPLTSPDWYVDANDGDDGHTGFATDAAFKTLSRVMRDVLPGDTVHAAEGTYAEGEMMAKKLTAGTNLVRSRVVVTNDVTLVATGSREKTIIEGDVATEAEVQETGSEDTQIGSFDLCFRNYGMGTNAMRAVTLYPGATVRGFTIRKGRTNVKNSEQQDYLGGGVLGFDATASVEDCVFTNNFSGRGTVVYATVRRCRFEDNVAAWNRPVATRSRLENVLAIHNVGANLADLCTGFYNCTFAENYSSTNRISYNVILFYQGNKLNVPFVNSILYQTGAQKNIFGDIRNSVFVGSCHYEGTNVSENVYTAAKLSDVLDADYRPIKGGTAMDKGTNNYVSEVGATDLAGIQRVYNATVDIGAYEYDWRTDFAAKLSQRVTVCEASPSVTMDETGVRIPSGASVALTARSQSEKQYLLKFIVPDAGQMTVTFGDQAKEYGAGTHVVTSPLLDAQTPMTLAYQGEDTSATLVSVRGNAGLFIICR